MPAAVSRPASGGPAWPAPMTMASKRFIATPARLERGADGHGVLENRGGKIAAEGRGQARPQRCPPSVPTTAPAMPAAPGAWAPPAVAPLRAPLP